MNEPAFVAFGANCGDPVAMYGRVAAALAVLPGVAAVRASRLLRSAPVGDSVSPYLNGMFEIAVEAAPREFFDSLRTAERSFGRVEKGNWAPRTVDLDLVLWGSHVVAEADFLLPHPRLHFRRFVLAPLAELRPDARHPLIGLRVDELLARLDPECVAIAGAATPESWPRQVTQWAGPAIVHGGQVLAGSFAPAAPLVALVDNPPASTGAATQPLTPVVDCRAAAPAAIARELAFLRQSLAPIEWLPRTATA